MKKSRLLTLAVFAFLAFAAANAVAQQPSAGTAPVHVVVTVEAHKGGETPVVNREDVMVHEGHDRDQPDRGVLAPEVGGRAFLHRAADLAHPLAPGGLLEHPDGQPDPEGDRGARAEERKQHGVMVEKRAQSASLTKSAPGCPGAAQFLSNGRPMRGGSASPAGAQRCAVPAEPLRDRPGHVHGVVAIAERHP